MNEHEEKFISAFLRKEKQERYRFLLNAPGRRHEAMDRLNHRDDLDPRFVTWLSSNADIATLLRNAGSPREVYIFTNGEIDGKTLSLREALEAVIENGWGAIVSCIPGQLAYYYDEDGQRRALLQRVP